ncbi:MAG: tyrosyl-tRNA synthetase [Candidatus Parcubacteria bacterium]|jgi:tyrosyl-tRNA synthetase|nr:tyrosyl-tRNA synthetase [Candidatus Parcubacteria bacterium]
MNDLANDLKARGLVDNSSAELGKILGTKRTVYLGVDPSADSMHAGNLLVVLILKRLADAGHSVQLIIGGGTGMIGDPKEKGERPLADEATVAKNKKAIASQMGEVLGRKVPVIDNADWLLKVKLVDFLRDIGKHFTVNELVKRDVIKRRLENEDDSISYTEFAYSLLQGYDYLVLNEKYGTDLQIGASDQWTNILSGVELIRRKAGKEAFALTTPLVTDSSGKKFGKSEGNAIWLDPRKTSPYAFYQFWLNQPDSVVEKYLKFYTFLSLMEISMLMEMHSREPGKRAAQGALAREVTGLVHGTDAAARCAVVSDVLFGSRALGSLSDEERAVLLAEAPTLKVAGDMTVADALVTSGLASSKSDAKRLVTGKGITLNDKTVDSPEALVTAAHFDDGLALLRRGKQVLVLTS